MCATASRIRALALAAALCVGAAAWAGPPVGRQAPDFALPTVEGSTVRLADLRGRPVVLNFWAFWCDTWKAEMPHLRRLAEHRRELGFEIIAVSVDGARLHTYKAREPGGAPFPVALDHGGAVSRAYGVTKVPTVLVLDAQGRVRYRASGYPGNQPILTALRRWASP